jgi:hypothetical protein
MGASVMRESYTVLGFPLLPSALYEDLCTSSDQPLLSGEHVQTMIYTGFGNAGADLIMARSSDAVIFGCGRINTIHEFTVALQEGKPIGILEGEWDTDDLLRDILKLEIDRAHETIFFDHDPNRLVERLIKAVKEKQS